MLPHESGVPIWLHHISILHCHSIAFTDTIDIIFRGPVNEDVFAALAFSEGKMMDSDIQEISEQIHRLLLQVCTRYISFIETPFNADFCKVL